MRNTEYFKEINNIHSNSQIVKLLNLILGAYNEIAELDQKVIELQNRIYAAALKAGIRPIDEEQDTVEDLTVAAAPNKDLEV